MLDREPDAIHSVTKHDGTTTITLRGEFDYANREKLHAVFDEIASLNVCLDLTKVEYIDSTVMSEIVRLRNRLADDGHDLKVLVAANGQLERILRIANLIDALGVTPV